MLPIKCKVQCSAFYTWIINDMQNINIDWGDYIGFDFVFLELP